MGEGVLFAGVVMMTLMFLAAGPMTAAQALTLNCGNAVNGAPAVSYFTLNTDTGTCQASPNSNPAQPANGVEFEMDRNFPTQLTYRARRSQNSVVNDTPGSDWAAVPYAGGRTDVAGSAQFLDTLTNANISVTVNVNGTDYLFTMSDVSWADGSPVVNHGVVTVTFVPVTPADKSNIANYLLSSFNQVGGGVFGPGGIPQAAVNNGGGSGFALAPSGGGSAVSFASPVDATNPMDREFGFLNQGNGNSGYAGLGGQSFSQGGKGANFSFNLQNMLANQRKKSHEALGVGGLKDGPYQPRVRWNAWAMGRYTDFDDDSSSADRDGHLWSFTSGLSYALSEQTTVGAFTRVRKGEVDSKALDASLDSDFFGGGVYLATTLGNGVRVMVAGAVEGGDSDIVISGDSGSFDTDEKTLEARIDKRFTKGRHWIEPALKVLYSDMERDGYTDSSGTFVSASDITLGRLTFGPTIGTTIQSGTTTIKPFARINGVWDFENQSDFTLSTGAVVSNADIAINLGGGLEIAFDSGVVLAAAADWFSFNDDLEGVTVTGSIGMPLSALGLGGIASAGLVSLDFSGNQSDASAQARLRIPLGGK